MKKALIIVAGGVGKRMQSQIPKQFIELNGKAIIFHTIEKFWTTYHNISTIVVLPKEELDRWKKLVTGTKFQDITVAIGGKTRFDSVKSGLKLLEAESIIAIHDAVRPLVSHTTICNCFEKAEKHGAAIPVLPLKESIRELSPNGSKLLARENFRTVQTPQCFSSTVLKKAYETEYQSIFTDDASVVEQSGIKIELVDGNYENIKLTTPEDLLIAKALL